MKRSEVCQKETHNPKPIGFEEAEYCISFRLCQVPNTRFFQIIPNSVLKRGFNTFFSCFPKADSRGDLFQSAQKQRTGKVFRRIARLNELFSRVFWFVKGSCRSWVVRDLRERALWSVEKSAQCRTHLGCFEFSMVVRKV